MKNEDASSTAGSPSLGQGHAGFLILKYPGHLSRESHDRIKAMAGPMAEEMGLKCLISSDGMDATVIPAGIGELVKVIGVQTEAVTRLAMSNEALIQAMIESEGMDEDLPPRTYLNGKSTL